MFETTYLTDHFLIAMPNLGDPNFSKTVTYICMHDENGAMGIVINRPMDIDLGDVFENMEIEVQDPQAQQLPIFDGGPVQTERGFVIHQPVRQWDAMLTVGNLGIATSRDIISAIAKGTGPDNLLIALGYAGWNAGQLEQEIANNAWLSTPANYDVIFNIPTEQRWQAAAATMGIDITLMSPIAGHG
jgi:putative transcriptional regulator